MLSSKIKVGDLKVNIIADIGLYGNHCMEYREFVRLAC